MDYKQTLESNVCCDSGIVLEIRSKICEIGRPKRIRVWHPNGEVEYLDATKGSRQRNQFFPRQDLRRLLDAETVKAVLEHTCRFCNIQRQKWDRDIGTMVSLRNHDLANVPRWVNQIRGKRENPANAETVLTIFGLLIFIRRPLLIIGFLESGSNDNGFLELTKTMSSNGQTLFNYFWPEFHEHQRKASEAAAKEFMDHMWSFAIPVIPMNDLQFTVFNEKQVLPYEENEYLDKGSYGRVFRVVIHEDYIPTIKPEHRAEAYARKEVIVGDGSIDVRQELSNLQRVQEKRHDHIIHFFTAYRYRSSFDPTALAYHFLMPLVQSNLFKYLRGMDQLDAKGGPSAILGMELHKQLRGIVGALKSMIVDQGMHRLDLKPQNILVHRRPHHAPGNAENHKDYEDVLLLSDFGQARFKKNLGATASARTNAHTNKGAFTDAYAPPEAIRARGQPSGHQPVYDIWSLGIIFVEILSFLAMGIKGPKELDEVRRSKTPGGESEDCRFWYEKPPILLSITGSEEVLRLKPKIEDWMCSLSGGTKFDEHDPEIKEKPEIKKFCKEYLERHIQLAGKMLQPDVTRRISIGKIEELLNSNETVPELVVPHDSHTAKIPTSGPSISIKITEPSADLPNVQIPIASPEGQPTPYSAPEPEPVSSILSDPCQAPRNIDQEDYTDEKPEPIPASPARPPSMTETNYSGQATISDASSGSRRVALLAASDERFIGRVEHIWYQSCNENPIEIQLLVTREWKEKLRSSHIITLRGRSYGAADENSTPPLRASRTSTNVIPLHILEPEESFAGKKYAVTFSPCRGLDGKYMGSNFSSTMLATDVKLDMKKLIRILTQQEVVFESSRAANITLNLKAMSIKGKVAGKVAAVFGREPEPRTEEYPVRRVEIWEEAPEEHIVDPANESVPSLVSIQRQQTFSTQGSLLSKPVVQHHAKTQRVAVYSERVILVMKFEAYLVAKQNDTMVQFIIEPPPTDPNGVKKRVKVLALQPNHPDEMPGVPMSLRVLHDQEETKQGSLIKRCSSVDLKFQSKPDARRMVEEYKRFKRGYRNEYGAGKSQAPIALA